MPEKIQTAFDRPSNFLTALAANATAKGVGIVLFSGNADALIPHLGTESTLSL
jgi:type 1 fimbria pilin